MPHPTPSQPTADHNLLFGILAVQMDFISRDSLVAAMSAWVVDKSRLLGQILLDQGHLTPQRLQLLTALVDEHMRAHRHDPRQSLAALAAGSSAVPDALRRLPDADVQASLAGLGGD